MLLKFSVENYSSFRDESVLNFFADKTNDYSTHLVPGPDGDILPVVALFGAHGSGKTNVLHGLMTMAGKVLSPEITLYLNPYSLENEYMFSPIFLEVALFLGEGEEAKEYNYGFKMMQRGAVVEEWLYIGSDDDKWKMQRIFERNASTGKYKVDNLDASSKERLESLDIPSDRLVLSLEEAQEIPELARVYEWFSNLSFLETQGLYSDIQEALVHLRECQDDPVEKESLIRFLKGCGLMLEDIIPYSNKDFTIIYADNKHIDATLESAAFYKLVNLYFVMKKCFETGGLLFIDDLDLHPLVIRNLIITFANQEVNSNHAQLVFSTQNIWFLSGDVLRDDEICFVEKGEDYASELYSLADFKKTARREDCIREYLLGRYGAIPHLEKLFGR